MAAARNQRAGHVASPWQADVPPSNEQQDYDSDDSFGSFDEEREYENDSQDQAEEYMNTDDIKWAQQQQFRANLNEGNRGASLPITPTTHSSTQQQPCQPMNKKKALPSLPAAANRPTPNHRYLELMHNEADDESASESNLVTRSAVNLFQQQHAHSGVELPKSPQSLQIQRKQQQNNSREAQTNLITRPLNMSLMPARNRSPASLSLPGAASEGVREYPFVDEPPTERAPAPPVQAKSNKKKKDASTQRPRMTSSDHSSSGLGTSSTYLPRTPDYKVKSEKSKPSKTKSKEENLHRFSWYKASMSREEAVKKVRGYKQNGSFVVRNSRTAGPGKPYVMTILCGGEMFHVPIRKRTDSFYGVGEEKTGELRFETVEDIIKHFHLNPIDLVLSDSQKHTEIFRTTLMYNS